MGLFRKKVTLETQLARLAEVGLVPNPGVGEEQLTVFEDRETMESRPYRGLVEALGLDLEEEPYPPLCDPLWMCDCERVEDHGAYLEVVNRLETMTARALDLTEISDHIDVEEEVAWVQFDHAGQLLRWDFEVDDDWLDPSVFVRYDQLLQRRDADVRIYSNHTDYGQSAFLAAFTRDQKRAFDKLSQVRLDPVFRN